MKTQILTVIADQLNIPSGQIQSTVQLLEQDATIPFISRYRKEVTGGLDEVQIGAIATAYDKLCELDKRKESILETIESQGKLTPELKARIQASWSSTEVEDIYLPFKPKRQTRAEVARKKGLEPLAKILMSQREGNITHRAAQFINDQVGSAEEAIQGAKDIIAEWIGEEEWTRNSVRAGFRNSATITSKVVKGKEAEGDKYRDLFEYSTPLNRCPSHRLLAIRRAENEKILRVDISPDTERCLERIERRFVKSGEPGAAIVSEVVGDAFKRLVKPSIETEFAAESKLKADVEAINVFSANLRQLLMAAPLGEKRVMGIDPGFRTGCKVVCLSAQGAMLHHDVIYPHPPQQDKSKANEKILRLVERYQIQAIAIGNGTASRETEDFIKETLATEKVAIYVVSENGASIYSASEVARAEFPDYDVTVRGSISIARRLMDPLAELVKIDPKSLGVGQYQYDVDQKALKKALDQVVESCVNQVGVDINTASSHLLQYVSGIGETLSRNIIEYRDTNGAFASREQIKKVARMGPKAYEQCAGFLRISKGSNPLDNTAVHPESYGVVELMARDLGCSVEDLISNKELKKGLDLKRYITAKVGMPTLNDIIAELDKPGRDPRGEVSAFEFDNTVRTISDLHEGMILPGVVNNITNFGCFVDIGIKENGLVHISQIAERRIATPTDAVALGQRVKVRVLEVDADRKRVSLSMRGIDK